MEVRLIDANSLKANRQLISADGTCMGERRYVTFEEIDRAPTMPGEPEFIPVDMTLPLTSGLYLVYMKKSGKYDIAFFATSDTTLDDKPCWLGTLVPDQITHWMPLPARPEEE